MFNLKRSVVAVATLVAVSSPVFAEEGVAAEIARINEEIALLSAKLKDTEIRALIAAKQAEIAKLSGAASGADMGGARPVVRGIEGADGKLKATLVFSGGVTDTVAKGDTTHGGWTVAEINVNSVFLSRGKERVRLGFGSEPPASPGVGHNPAAPGFR